MKKILLLLGLTAGFQALAQDYPINSDRPGQSLTPRTLEKGLFQLQGGVDGLFENSESIFPNLDFRMGVTSYLEVNFSTNAKFGRDGLLIQSNYLGLRGNIYTGETWSLGVSARVWQSTLGQLPYELNELITEDHGFSTKILFDATIGPKWTLFSNLGFENQPNGDFHVPHTLGIAYGSEWGWFAEYYGSFQGDLYPGFDAGAFWLITPSFRLDFQAGLSHYSPSTNYFAGLGFTWKPFNH